MSKPRTPIQEQYRLVMDCRKSGMSDARWCEENNIHTSTFYNWVARLRKRGCEIPAPAGKADFLPTPHQDVVQIDVVPDIPYVEAVPTHSLPSREALVPCMKIEINGASLEVSNNTDPELLVSVLRLLRGASC